MVEPEGQQSVFVVAGAPGNANRPADDTAIFDDVVIYASGHVGRQSEADTFIRPASGGDHRVHSDHFAPDIQQSASAVAGIDSGVRLNKMLKLLLHAQVGQIAAG